jgi:septum formation protein
VSAPVAEGARLVLASASPRRRELLSLLGVWFAVLPAAIDEAVPRHEPAAAAVARLAREKARAVRARRPEWSILAADTLVELDGVTLGKPDSPEAARRSLLALRGRTHTVWSGVCLLAGRSEEQAVVGTEVRMRRYADAEIERTIALGTPFDKAGAYAIQDIDFRPVESIHGCYCNVMGLPLWTVHGLLQAAEIGPAVRPPDAARPECVTCPLPRSIQSPARLPRSV